MQGGWGLEALTGTGVMLEWVPEPGAGTRSAPAAPLNLDTAGRERWVLRVASHWEGWKLLRMPLHVIRYSQQTMVPFLICLLFYAEETRAVWKCYPDLLNEAKRVLQIH